MTSQTRQHRLSGAGMVVLAAGLAGIGLLMLAGAGISYLSQRAFAARAVVTEGVVVALERRIETDRNSPTRMSFAAVFEFSLPDGRRQRVVSSASSDPPCCQVGETVRVRYDPQRPDRAALDNLLSNWGWTIALGGLGTVLLLAAGAGVVQGRRTAALERTQGWRALPVAGIRMLSRFEGTQWVVQAQWTDPRDGSLCLFEADPLDYDPAPQMQGRMTIDVLFDQDRPEASHRVDLSFLRDPRPAPQD